MPDTNLNISTIVENFANQLVAAVEASAVQRIQAALSGAFGAPQKRGPGRPSKQLAATAPSTPAASAQKRKSPPKQLCPVPGCKNVAAPVFGMVCKDHRNVAKSKIEKYRKERRADKGTQAQAPSAKPAAAKKAKPATPKVLRARKLQGQYLGALKSLAGADRARVKQTAKEKGVAEAVKLAMSLKKS
jgi:hypothetical protein